MTRSALTFALALLVASCGADPSRITLPPVETAQSVRVSVGSIEVTQVSLPLYAESEEIAVEAESGALVTEDGLLWADDPRRAATQALVANLSSLTTAKVAAEPWPFDQFPDVRLVVRFDRFLPKASGQFEIAGQYYVARVNGNIRETAESFALSAPYALGDAVSISAAQANVLRDLATLIASSSL